MRSNHQVPHLTGPEYGGDTFWSSGYVAEDGPSCKEVILMITYSYTLYASLSLEMQAYLEGLAALHSAVASGGISGLHRVVSTVGGVDSDGGYAPFVMITQLSDHGLL